ncbi:hypothetical protein [Bartonella sp. HY761]|uniref:hypothetical protein n=1 Tax=Bartonella sp. HY761 TaxID=2979330 RepID=UPI00220F6198|nr:hypothetical protein [Bartonella sp. HY761]UXN07442.1 capsular polysaccharide synthesis protein [Bartonella sp. HY761]
MDICTFWYGEKLRYIDQLCLASMVQTGQHVKLYAHNHVEGVPEGVELCDAEPILPLSLLYKLDPSFPSFKPSRSIVQFSDIFRVMLMKYQKGVWLDTDIYLVKQFHPNPNEVWLASDNARRVGVSALYLPPDNPIIAEFENYINGTNLVPSWLGFKKRVWLPFLLKLKNEPVQPNHLGITIFGNDGISRLAKKYHFFDKAKPRESFYYWSGRDAEKIFDPAFGIEPTLNKDFIGFHIHKKAKTEQPPIEGSFFDWAIKRTLLS